jgi:putative DNA primase/helicase
MERRMRVVPFNVKPAVVDPTLKDRLVEEYPAILRWMLDGCLAWQAERVGWCERVRNASTEYFEDQNPLGSWIAERCVVDPAASGVSSDLHADFSMWMRGANLKPPTASTFKEMLLREPGIGRKRITAGQLYTGIALRRGENEV